MRTLVILRGSPGSGKSSWVKENDLSQYTLCPDDIRLLFQSPVMTPYGNLQISQKNDKKVWALLFELLEERMMRGEFTIIDAVHSRNKDFTKYEKLASEYKYRVFCVDFTDVPIEVCKERNKHRGYKSVPEDVIDNIYSRFQNFKPQTWVKIIKPSEFNDIFRNFKPLDFSDTKKIHIFGDIHGCFTVLKNYLPDGFKDDEKYIFVGDYIDRGMENSEVLKFFIDNMDNKNVFFLEGNHEIHLWKWSTEKLSKSNEFECITRPEIEKSGIDKKDIRRFYRRLSQICYFKYNDKNFVITHGGLSNFDEKEIQFVSTYQLIHGPGYYQDSDASDISFSKNTPQNFYSIHGHRNVSDSPIKTSERAYNLENKVEYGKPLRILTIDNEGIRTDELPNTVFRLRELPKSIHDNPPSMKNDDFLQQLRKNPGIKEIRQDNNISSFNFNKKVFYDKSWDEMNTKARGLFINTVTGEIVARSYNKFFNIGERPETQLDALQHTMRFPAYAYKKENGFLGLVGYDSYSDSLILTSKAMIVGDFVSFFRDIWSSMKVDENKLKEYLKTNGVSLVFEVVDPINDPHIIEYVSKKIVLLDIVRREVEYHKLPYENVVQLGKDFNFEVKEQSIKLNNWSEFFAWYNDVTAKDYAFGDKIEGFVIEDASGYMVKAKLYYYRTWKYMRSIKDKIRAGRAHMVNSSSLTTPEMNNFFGWAKNQPLHELEKDIIYLRRRFFEMHIN